MHSFKLPESPSYLTYLGYVILFIFFIILFKKVKNSKKQKEGCAFLLFYSLITIPFCNFLLSLTFGCLYSLYGILFYPKYEAKIVDSFIEYMQNGKTGKPTHFNYAVLELNDKKGNTIRIHSNEGSYTSPIIGKKTIVSYKNGVLINISFWPIVFYIASILVSLFIISILVFVFYYKI